MAYNYLRAQKVALRLIKKFGATCVLRRTEGDRECIAAEVELSVEERKLMQPYEKLYLIAAVGLDLGPHKDNDTLVTFDSEGNESEQYKFTKAPLAFKPARIVVYWDCWVKGAYVND